MPPGKRTLDDEEDQMVDVGEATGNLAKRSHALVAEQTATNRSDGNMSFPPYRELPESEKELIRAAVKTGETAGLNSTAKHYVSIFRAKKFARGIRQVKRTSKGNYRGRGAYKSKSKYPRRRFRPTALSTVAKYARDGISMSKAYGETLHSFPPATQAWLQVVGSPFTTLKDVPHQIMPRRPDPDFAGSSVAVQITSRTQLNANYPYSAGASAAGGAITFALAFPFGLGGLDVVGNQTATGLGTANFPQLYTAAALLTYVTNEMLPRLTNGQQNYTTFFNQTLDMQKWRITAAGIKEHDVGQVLTRQGEMFGHEVNFGKFMESIQQQYASMPADVKMALMQLGIRGLLDYNTSVAAGAAYTTPAANVRAIVEQARQAATANSDVGEEKTPDMGMTQRYREPRTEVDYVDLNPLVFVYDPNATVAAGVKHTWAAYKPIISAKFDGAAQFLEDYAASVGESMVAIYVVRSGNYYWYTAESANRTWLLNKDMLPLYWAEQQIALKLGNQGNSLLCIELSQMAKDGGGVGRVINCYRSSWLEMQVQGTSALYQTQAPQDASYTQLVELANNFPVTVRGFSFFSDLWSGVKKAAAWVGRNEASIVKGVQAGVRVAKMLA